MSEKAIERVRSEPNPIRRARLAGEVMVELQQAELEVSRLRRQAIEDAAATGLSYSEVARQVGLTRGRVSQIRSDGPPPEREFFGIGPIQLGIPLRPMPAREQPVVATEDLKARDELTQLLTNLSFHVEHLEIDPKTNWEPTSSDLLAICGPKSSATISELLEIDPNFVYAPDEEGRWHLSDRATKQRYSSGIDEPNPSNHDVAYLGRLRFDDERSIILIAGIHAIGSLGAVHYLRNNLANLYGQVGTEAFSMVVSSTYEDGTILTSEEACPPQVH